MTFFERLLTGIVFNSIRGKKHSESPRPKKILSEEEMLLAFWESCSPMHELKNWLSKFDTRIAEDFVDYDWFDFYPTKKPNTNLQLPPMTTLNCFDVPVDIDHYFSLEKCIIRDPDDIDAHCLFAELCFMLLSNGVILDFNNDENGLPFSLYSQEERINRIMINIREQLYEKLHRSLSIIINHDEYDITKEARKCCACVLDAEFYCHKNQFTKALKRYFSALNCNMLLASPWAGTQCLDIGGWNILLSEVLINMACIYSLCGLNAEITELYNRFSVAVQTSIKLNTDIYRKYSLMEDTLPNRYIVSSAKREINSLKNPLHPECSFVFHVPLGTHSTLLNVYNSNALVCTPIALTNTSSTSLFSDLYAYNPKEKQTYLKSDSIELIDQQKEEIKRYLI